MGNNRFVVALSIALLATLVAPIASATVTANAGPDRTVETGQPITFDASGSSASGESVHTYTWHFGDNTTGTGTTYSKTYTSAGTYTVTLFAYGTGGSVSTDTASITVRTTDTSAPSIAHTNVTTGTSNSAISVTADVTDNIGVLAVTLFYKRSNESTYQSTTMTCTGSATSQDCSGSIPSSVTDGAAVNYYLRATDTKSGTPNTGYWPTSAPSANVTVTLTDTAAPTITHTPPTSATAGSSLNITATIADTVAVDTVTLYYDFNASTTFALNTTMTRASGTALNGTYYATISGASLPAGGTVKYYIQANDTSNNVRREPSTAPGCFSAATCANTTIGIVGASAPSIDHTAVSAATAGDDLSISATVTPGSGRAISSVMVRYRALGSSDTFANATMTNATGASTLYTGTIPGAAIGDEGIEYYIRANDSAGELVYSPSAGSSAPRQVTAPPGTPTSVGVSRSSSGVTVSWTAPATAADDTVASYNVYRSADGSSYALVTTTTSTSALDASAIDGVLYSYKVSAVDDAGAEGTRSSAAATSDEGYRPSMPSVTATPSSGALSLSWTGNAAANGWYLVSYATSNGTFTLAQNVTVEDASATFSASLSGLTDGQAYVVRVLPYNPYDEPSLTPAFLTATPGASSGGDSGGGGGGSGGGGGGGSGTTPTTGTNATSTTNTTNTTGPTNATTATNDTDASAPTTGGTTTPPTNTSGSDATNETAPPAEEPAVPTPTPSPSQDPSPTPSPATPSPESEDDAAPVPGFGLVALLGAAVASAYVLRRR